MIFLRSTVFNIVMVLWAILYGFAILPSLLLPREKILAYARPWKRSCLWMVRVICGVKYEIRGLENIPQDKRAYIVAMKHQSTFETLLAGLIFHDFLIIHKKELTYIPIFGWYLKWANMVSINRAKGQEALEQICSQIREKMFVGDGRPLVIFPEGTRTPVGADRKYKSGIYNIQEEFSLPVYPVALNSGLFWARKAYNKYPGTIVISILPKLEVPKDANRKIFMDTLKEIIETETAKIVEESKK